MVCSSVGSPITAQSALSPALMAALVPIPVSSSSTQAANSTRPRGRAIRRFSATIAMAMPASPAFMSQEPRP